MDKDELRAKLAAIKQTGFVVSQRRGNTGIGYTLENLLGVSENNIQAPDLGTVEIKSHRRHAASMVTMFTFNKGVWRIPQAEVVQKYGYTDATGRQALYSTTNTIANSMGLYLNTNNDDVQLVHVDGTVIAEWDRENLMQTFKKKLPALVVVIADTRTNSFNKEEFHYNEAQFLTNPSGHQFIELIKTNRVVIDIRMHITAGVTVRNHGTGFRIEEGFLNLCFAEKERLL